MSTIARIRTATLVGLDALPVDVEVHVINRGQPSFSVIGLGDSAVKEARDRVISALRQSGFTAPSRILVNLAPAEIRKEGASFDLAIALGILLASQQVRIDPARNLSVHGELSLDGGLKAIRGMVALAMSAQREQVTELLIPTSNVAEARLVSPQNVNGFESLAHVAAYLRGSRAPSEVSAEPLGVENPRTVDRDLSDVWGQDRAKRALLIAAAGNHNLLMIGPPGCGKSMLAERFGSLLPPLSGDEALEAVKIHSIAGLPVRALLSGKRPYRVPHHVVSDVGLVGGGASPRPGEISLAHGGVLFLDEFPEFRRSALEALRGPIESGRVTITRAKGTLEFPARFQLLAAMNPCPCGRLGSSACVCSRQQIQQYLAKLSGPILDRIDLHVELEAVPLHAMIGNEQKNSPSLNAEWCAMVEEAHAGQRARQRVLNAHLEGEQVLKQLQVHSETVRLLERAATRERWSARSCVRVLRVARTIADLENQKDIQPRHLAEALDLRRLDRLERYVREAA